MPPFGQARGVQIDIDGRMIGIRYPMEVNLIGDARDTLRSLIPMIERKEDRSWREELEEGVRDWWKLVEDRAMLHADPINPQRIYWELNKYLPDNCIIAGDCGANTDWFGRDVRLREGMRASLSGTLATMGSGTPYAIAAKFAYPERPVLALVGDGATQMNGMNEWLTIAKYWKRWADPRLVIQVLHNNDLNQVTWELRVLEGDPKFEASQDIPDFDYAAYARLVGLNGIRVEKPEDIAGAWEEAFAARRPTVIDTLASGDVPPLPPHITWEQSMNMLKALLKGDPNELAIMRQSFNNVFAEYVPGQGI
jgi:pyruvate dehydrogenase (quinone)